MTDLTTPSIPTTDVAPALVAPVTETAVVITEQEVLFSTAAAVPLQPAAPHRFADAAHTVAVGVRGLFVISRKEKLRRHYYPGHTDYLESALMRRMMDRL